MNLPLSRLPEKNTVENEDLLMISNLSNGLPSSKRITIATLAQSLWKQMYEQSVIVRCGHCNSNNVVTNSTCIQCGAPGGDFLKLK